MGYELTSKKKNKEVRYLNKDFSQFRNNLIEFSKQYFPNTYQDFNESSPGMMFIEMASYVGDVMSYYVDSQFKESLLGYSEELRTLYSMAQSFGYKPRLSAPSSTKLEFNSCFLISLIFTFTSLSVIFVIFFFIFSISAPFFPITNPGLEVCIETVHFFDDLSIIISDTPEFMIFFLM